MNDATLYTLLSHLDAPKRILTLTIDEFVVALLGMSLLVISSHKLLVSGAGFLLFLSLKQLKKGESPRYLLVLAYWYLPQMVTQLFLPKLPASHYRVWRA